MAADQDQRIRVRGKHFVRGGKPWLAKGLTYGPFSPAEKNDGLPEPSRVRFDLDSIVQVGANLVRVYELPPEWFLDACAEAGLKVLISIPWTSHVDFLRDRDEQEKSRFIVREAVNRYRGHRAVFGYLVGNEIEATLVRWMGTGDVADFIDSLCMVAKETDDQALVSYGNYPTTEFLQPRESDFCAFNVFLEDRAAFAGYVARAQHMAGDKPLLISEFGADSKSLGENQQAEIIQWGTREGTENGVAGMIVFAFTDQWFRGHPVLGWDFGVVRRERDPKVAYGVLMDTWKAWKKPADVPTLPERKKVSVIVCTYNGSATIGSCLDSLLALDYPDYEILVVDDGSTDDTRSIISRREGVRLIKQKHGGLSAARNRGAGEAKGDIFAYTDDDCFVEEDWLTQVVATMERGDFAACGGPNIPPSVNDPVAALVTVAPGAPVHVMLDDREAEHIPGCNLFVHREAFEEIGGFREAFRVAGDDVDFCWRLQDAGHRIGFSPLGFVWHHRRATIRAYLRQQAGYGKAEAELSRRHPDRFGQFGGALWRGAIYEPEHLPQRGGRSYRLFRGVFGNALFPSVYTRPASDWHNIVTSIPWLFVGLCALMAAFFRPAFFFLGIPFLLFTAIMTGRRALEIRLPKEARGGRWRLVLIGMCMAQPIVRSLNRFSWPKRLPKLSKPRDSGGSSLFRWPRIGILGKTIGEMSFWSEKEVHREELLARLRAALERMGHRFAVDDGWRDWDIELRDSRFWRVRLTTVTEYHGDRGRLLRLRFASRVTR
ncbi:MAG: glycosyltransferase, partial [Verrucomicrobiota bacterium]